MDNRKPHITLADVARRAKVGTSTVSRVINGGQLVSPATLERVRAVIQEFDFQPNQAARILKGGSTKTIGLIVPSIADPFFALCAESAQEVARRHGFLLIVTSSNNIPGLERESVSNLIQRRVDGILFAPAASTNQELLHILTRSSIPAVSLDRPLYNSSVPAVLTSNYEGAKKATEHLISHGRKRIVCLGMKGENALYTSNERILGYRDGMLAAALSPEIDFSMAGYQSAASILEKYFREPDPPDAIFAIRNLVSIYTYRVLRAMKIVIPRTVALIGFDDFELASNLQPSITVVRQPMQEIGKVAAELLFEEVLQKKKHRAKMATKKRQQHIAILETELVIRSSCGCGQ